LGSFTVFTTATLTVPRAEQDSKSRLLRLRESRSRKLTDSARASLRAQDPWCCYRNGTGLSDNLDYALLRVGLLAETSKPDMTVPSCEAASCSVSVSIAGKTNPDNGPDYS